MRKFLCGAFVAAFLVTATRCEEIPPTPYADDPPKPWCHEHIATALPSPFYPTYTEARAAAIAQGVPLVVWVDPIYEDAVPGCANVVVPTFAGMPTRGVVIGKPDGKGDINRFLDLPGAQTWHTVLDALNPPKKSAPAAGICVGGCGPGCDCNGTKGGTCTHCPPSAKVRPPISAVPAPPSDRRPPIGAYVPPPSGRVFLYQNCGPRG